MRHLILTALLFSSCLVAPRPAYAFVSALWDYIKQYQLGVDYTSSYDKIEASYEMQKGDADTSSCAAVQGKEDRARCSVGMEAGSGSGFGGFGIFLQQAFRRQGTLYFQPNISFGVRYLNGRLDDESKRKEIEAGRPLRDMRFSLAAVVMKPYIQFGITPASRWPDILFSMGPVAQVALGRVRVNEESSAVATATSSNLLGGFFALELVFLRFGDGAFSIFSSHDVTGDGQGTKFYPKGVDGMDDIRANFSREISGGFFGLGAKLVLNWP